MAVRQPILKELLGYKKATSETAKEAHRRKLRELFESVDASTAEPFQSMLSTQNALAVTFRGVLQGDPLQNELLGILATKYAPDPSQCTPSAPSPAPPSGVTLPGVTLTDEEAFVRSNMMLGGGPFTPVEKLKPGDRWLPPNEWAGSHANEILKRHKAAVRATTSKPGSAGDPYNAAARELDELAKTKGLLQENAEALKVKAEQFRSRARELNHPGGRR